MNKKRRQIISAILIVIVLLAGGAGAYGIYTQQHSHKTNKTSKVVKTKRTSSYKKSTSEKKKKTNKKHSTSSNTSSSTTSSQSSDSQTKTASTNATSTSNDDKGMTRQSAVSAATKLLQAVQVAPDGKTSEADRLKQLKANTDPKKILTQDTWDQIHLSDFMSSDKRGPKLTAQALLNVVSSIESDGNKSLTPAKMDYTGVVYLDNTTKTAYVPLNLYTDASTNISLEMVYINGQWKLSPFSLISEISIRLVSNDSIKGSPEADENSSSNSGTLPNQSSSSSSSSSSTK